MRALACLIVFMGSAVAPQPLRALTFADAQSQRALALLNAQSCAARLRDQVAQVSPSPAPTVSPTATPYAPSVGGPGQLYATPFPLSSPVTPPPVPTPTPVSTASSGPVFLVRPSGTPSIAPKPEATPAASPTPLAAPTLEPGHVAVMADKISGSTRPGVPGDATGNVHIFYQDEVLVGDRAHYDGIRTITVTGDPYIVNRSKDSILYADRITFDTVAQKAELFNGRGESSQGVERGLVFFGAKDLRSDQHGVAHGINATATTCERPRAGYHITGRTIDVTPGDKIVISKAILWLGAAAIFFLPRVVIPLRSVSDERQRPQFFPDVGYNSVQGYYIRARLSFGRDQYYYGYYTIEFYTKQGTTLGYNGTFAKRNGKRTTNINVQRVASHLPPAPSVNYNFALQDTENFSQTLHGNLQYNYQSAYGPFTNFPTTQNLNLGVAHAGLTESQTYQYSRQNTALQGSSDSFGFTDSRLFTRTMQNNFSASISRTQTSVGTFISNSTATVNDLLHWSTAAADYQLTFDKTFAQQPFGINKEPELQVMPHLFLSHFIFPIAPTLTIGQYNEPQTPETTSRADLALNLGPALYNVYGSQFSANVQVHQYAYGTGDLKASINQQMSLTSQIGSHVNNVISYTEANYNGPGAVPFSTLDLQNSQNLKDATDTLRFYNSDIYNLTLNFATSFNGIAQPVSYQLVTRPSPRSYAALTGAFNPGPGQGFFSTNAQFSTPFGRGAWLQFQGDIDWKNKARIENKSIYYSRIIGDCYQIALSYNQNSRELNATINILAFPSHAATFGLTNRGSLIPSSFNGFNYGGGYP
jgi:hypothetical protein